MLSYLALAPPVVLSEVKPNKNDIGHSAAGELQSSPYKSLVRSCDTCPHKSPNGNGLVGIQRGGENDRNDGRVSRVKVGEFLMLAFHYALHRTLYSCVLALAGYLALRCRVRVGAVLSSLASTLASLLRRLLAVACWVLALIVAPSCNGAP